MSHFQTFIAILQSVVSDITQTEGLSFVQRKTLTASLIKTLVASNTLLTEEEKMLVNIIIPFLISDKEKVKGCMASLFGRCKKKKTPQISEPIPAPIPVIIPTPLVPTPEEV